jgi:hypothetical protein
MSPAACDSLQALMISSSSKATCIANLENRSQLTSTARYRALTDIGTYLSSKTPDT